MDIKSLEGLIEYKSWQKQSADLYDSRSMESAYVEDVRERGRELARLYIERVKVFEEIFEFAEDPDSDPVRPFTRDIVINHHSDPELGDGKIVAVLVAPNFELHGLKYVVSTFMFVTEGSVKHTLGNERFDAFGNTLGNEFEFLRDNYRWEQGTVDNNRFSSGYKELMPVIDAAQETQDMLVTAMQNPELNPEIAAEIATVVGINNIF